MESCYKPILMFPYKQINRKSLVFRPLPEYLEPLVRETPVFWEPVLGDSILTSVTSDL